jgi:hypothetical protein
MSEVDAGLRNERLTFETDLDLLKEETSLELEIDMEERLNDFKNRKENEVATQLERQLDKREEIMRNKALIDVRKREAAIRAEIEAQLGLKRAEIRDRLSGLSDKMDAFKEMAEEKMRDAVTNQIQGEIDRDQSTLQSREQEFKELQSQDDKVDKRQTWMQAISGQGTQGMQATGTDPSLLGARSGTSAAGGRMLGGMLGAAAQQHQPSIGLAGMRSPITSAKPLSATIPLAKPVKSPLLQPTIASTTAGLPAPIQQKVVRSPLMPIQPQVQPVSTPVDPIEQTPTLVQPVSVPVDSIETPVDSIETPVDSIEQVEEIVSEEGISLINVEDELVEEIADELVAELEEEVADEVIVELENEPKTGLLKPIRAKLSPIGTTESKTATLSPVRPLLQPVKKSRGSPPKSKKGESPSDESKESMATLTPMKTMTPLKIERKKMQPSEKEDD